MKRYKLLLALVVSVSAILASCNKDFLDQPAEDQVEAEFFFNTAKDLEVATNDFYTMLATTSVYSDDAASDNIVPLITADRVRGNRIVPTASGSGGWSWGRLRDINYFLANYHKVKDEDAKAKYSGIARFFRAYFYYTKVKTFGDVPWYNKVLSADDPDLYKPRDSRILVMDSVMADIDYAIENIPAEKQLSKITKYTALLLKARIALFEGTFRKYHGIAGYEHFLTEAADAANTLMLSGAYTLYKTGGKDNAYRDLFARNNQDDVETILSVDFEPSLQTHNLGYLMTSPTAGAWGLTKDLVNSYLMTDGTPFTNQANYKTKGYYEEFQNRDPRLAQTTAGPSFRVKGETANEPVTLNLTTTGYRVIKALPTRDQWGITGYFDVIIFRYAEALLIFAEAKAELNTLTQLDLTNSINLLRSRVEMPPLNLLTANANPDPYQEAMYPNVEGPNKGVILEIRRERRIEMFNEGLRWDDLMRWKAGLKLTQPMVGIYFSGTGPFDFTGDGNADVFVHTGSTSGAPSSVTSFINIQQRTLRNPINGLPNSSAGNLDPFTQGGAFNELRDYLAPIPLEDIKLNPKLVQNPKWDN